MECYRIINDQGLLFLLKDDDRSEILKKGDYILISEKNIKVASTQNDYSDIHIDTFDYKTLCKKGKLKKVSYKFFKKDLELQYELKVIKQTIEMLEKKELRGEDKKNTIKQLTKQYKLKTIALERAVKKEVKKTKKQSR